MVITEHTTGAELALALEVPLYLPDALAKALFSTPVYGLTAEQLEVLTALITEGEASYLSHL